MIKLVVFTHPWKEAARLISSESTLTVPLILMWPCASPDLGGTYQGTSVNPLSSIAPVLIAACIMDALSPVADTEGLAASFSVYPKCSYGNSKVLLKV